MHVLVHLLLPKSDLDTYKSIGPDIDMTYYYKLSSDPKEKRHERQQKEKEVGSFLPSSRKKVGYLRDT